MFKFLKKKRKFRLFLQVKKLSNRSFRISEVSMPKIGDKISFMGRQFTISYVNKMGPPFYVETEESIKDN